MGSTNQSDHVWWRKVQIGPGTAPGLLAGGLLTEHLNLQHPSPPCVRPASATCRSNALSLLLGGITRTSYSAER